MTNEPDSFVNDYDAIIIGGGISGLATANALTRKGKKVYLIERSSRLGGAVQSEIKEGYLCEAGPNSMLVKSELVWNYLTDDLGLKSTMVMANEISNKRFLVKKGRMVALPQSIMGGVTTPLYSIPEKMRLLLEPFIGRSELEDESVTSFVSRRMGSAFLEYGISALVSGIYAGDPDKLSLRHAFGKVWNLEQTYGSLIGGAIKLRRERKKSGIVPFKSKMISFENGLQELVTALSKPPWLTISKGVEATAIKRDANGSWVVTEDPELPDLRAKDLILSTPLDAYEYLPVEADLRKHLDSIKIPDHPPLSTLVLGFERDQVAHPLDGFGVLCPRLEKRFGLGAIFSSTLFPNRAPEGKVSLMCFIGGVQQPENAELPTVKLVEEVVKDLKPLLGISGLPDFVSHKFWPRAIPQYNVGHQDFLDSLETIENQFPGLHLRGNFRGGPGLNDCIESALEFCGLNH